MTIGQERIIDGHREPPRLGELDDALEVERETLDQLTQAKRGNFDDYTIRQADAEHARAQNWLGAVVARFNQSRSN
jgi:hypothetical protein